MADHKWDLKSNYMLTFTICKYGSHSEPWNLVANDLADYINITPQNCQIQFDRLCQQYGHDWQKQSIEPLHSYIFTIIKRLYYGDLCERMTESRDLLLVMYDFIRLFKMGRITLRDANGILQDMKNTVSTGNNMQDNEREHKINMLGRLKLYMMKQNPLTTDTPCSSFPVELLPPPPFFQTQQLSHTNSTLQNQTISPPNENDRQVPSIDIRPKVNPPELSLFPIIVQSNNLLIENERQFITKNQIKEIHIDEIELSSDDDIQERTTTPPPSITNSNLAHIQDEAILISDELMETNQSSNALPMASEISSSNDRDSYEHVSNTSLSNQSTIDTCLSVQEQVTMSSDQPQLPNLHANSSNSVSSDYTSKQNHNQHSIQNESLSTTSEPTLVEDDDDDAQMHMSVPNGQASSATNASVSNGNILKSSPNNVDQHSLASSAETQETVDTTTPRSLRRQPRLITNLTTNNNRKSINAILNGLKSAKYGYDFAQSLDSFELPNEYYIQIKNLLDIPEIRERMNNGDYDDDILLFQRDILLMFTNALYAYHRDLDIHKHAQFMIKYSMELFTAMKDMLVPWKQENNPNSSPKSLRRQAIVNYPTTPKRQRKTMN